MNSTVTYTGPFESVTVVDPSTGREFPCARDKRSSLPTRIAARVAYQSPDSWDVGADVALAVEDLKAEIAAAEAAKTVNAPADVSASLHPADETAATLENQ